MEERIEYIISTGMFSVTNNDNGYVIYVTFEENSYSVDADGKIFIYGEFSDAYAKFTENKKHNIR